MSNYLDDEYQAFESRQVMAERGESPPRDAATTDLHLVIQHLLNDRDLLEQTIVSRRAELAELEAQRKAADDALIARAAAEDEASALRARVAELETLLHGCPVSEPGYTELALARKAIRAAEEVDQAYNPEEREKAPAELKVRVFEYWAAKRDQALASASDYDSDCAAYDGYERGYQAGLAEVYEKCVVCGCAPPDHFLDAHIEFARAAAQDAEAAYVRGIEQGRRAERADLIRWQGSRDGSIYFHDKVCWKQFREEIQRGAHINAAKTDESSSPPEAK